MGTAIVWLLVALGGNGGNPTVLERFTTQQGCEEFRKQAIDKISSFYSSQSACIPKRAGQ